MPPGPALVMLPFLLPLLDQVDLDSIQLSAGCTGSNSG